MNEALIIANLVDAIESAIEKGDWVVDGACDPDIALSNAVEYLKMVGMHKRKFEPALKA